VSAVVQERRRRLMHDLAIEGASRCCYLPGAGNPEAWTTSTCDCKHRPLIVDLRLGTSEQTGCVEMRAAWRVLAWEVGR
jgi:hypothetical protein